MAFQKQSTSTSGTLVLTRDDGFIGSACFYAFWINNILAARLSPMESATFYLEPGEHLLKVGRDPEGVGLCGTAADNWTQRETTLKPHDRKLFRLSIDENGKLDIQRAE